MPLPAKDVSAVQRLRTWIIRPGQRWYYAWSLWTLVFFAGTAVTRPSAWTMGLLGVAVAVALYRFLRYPPWKHSELLRDRREAREVAATDLRRPD